MGIMQTLLSVLPWYVKCDIV